MNITDLTNAVNEATWFSNLGKCQKASSLICLNSLQDEFRNPDESSQFSTFIINQMEWLPTGRDMEDPIHKGMLKIIAHEQKKDGECRKVSSDIYKIALLSLRQTDQNPLLNIGALDLTEAAKGSALYTFRSAAWEIILNRTEFWCTLIPFYVAGNWPCGLTRDKKVVVF